MRLAAFSFLAVLPMLALVWHGAELDRQQSLATARQQLLALARVTADQQDSVIQGAESLLRVLVRLPAVSEPFNTDCHHILQVVAQDNPRIAVLAVTDASGIIFCNSRDEKPHYSVADRPYFQELMVPSPPGYAISRLVWSRITNQPVIVVAVPLPETTADGFPIGLALASLNSDWLSGFPQTSGIADGRSISIVDGETGAILATSPKTMSREPQSLPEVANAARGGSSTGVVDASDPEGVASVFGFADLPGSQGKLLVTVGLSRQMILGQANWQLDLDLGFALAAAIMTALLAYGVAHLWLLRPIDQIVEAVRDLGRGSRPARIAAQDISVSELHSLAVTINVMVDEISARDEDLHSMHQALASSEQHHRELAENVTDMISRLSPDFNRTYVSPSCKTLLGYEPEEMIGSAARGIVHADDWPLLDATLNAPLRSGADESSAVYRAFRKDGSETWLESSSRRLTDGSGFVVVTRDISERKRFEAALEEANARLEVHARQDALTGLANRRSFDETLEVEWQRSRRDRHCLGLLLVDIDFFKAYNDTLGHQAGDECLRVVGEALASVKRRSGDVVARYGGEEFAVILPNADLAGVADVGERLLDAVRLLAIPHPTSPNSIVTVSVGAASTGLPSGELYSPHELVRSSDTALYQAKNGGRNTIRIHYNLSTIVSNG